MKNVFVAISFVLASSIPSLASTQAMAPPDQEKVKVAVEQTQAIKTKVDEVQGGGPRFVRTLTNVQVELTLTDQTAAAAPVKKTVSMLVSSGTWGKIRNNAASSGRFPVALSVDARPFVSLEGPIQLELTIYYYPLQGDPKEPGTPTELNQSTTVILQSGKPMAISQAADPASDRRITVEVKATILK